MHKVQGSKAPKYQHAVKGGSKKIKVFKKTQNTKVADNTDQQKSLFAPGILRRKYFFTNPEIDTRRDKDQSQKAPIPVAIKNVAAKEEKGIPITKRKSIMEGHDQPQKEQENKGIEKHSLFIIQV